jgi:hypothetical protein
MKIYAVFCSNKSKWMKGGELIKWAEDISFSHCAVFIEDEHGRTEVYESVWPKSRKMPMEKWLEHYKVEEIYDFHVVDETMFRGIKLYLRGKLRRWYSTFQLFWIGIGLFIKPLNKFISKKPVNGSKHLICTELTGDVFKRFYGAKWDESTDTLSLRDTRDEIKRLWSIYANIPSA